MIDPSADVASTATVPASARVWGLAQIREGATLGERTIVGRGAYIGVNVSVGSDAKIQSNALIYDPAVLEDGVFIGPSVILTNDRRPRAVNPDGSLKSASDWLPVGVTVRNGASLGAGAICVAPVEVGPWAMVAAGSVVTRDVPPFALVVGSPARHVGWVSRAGFALERTEAGRWVCPSTGETYVETSGNAIALESTGGQA